MEVAVLFRAPSWAIRLQRLAGIVVDLDTQAGTEAGSKIPGRQSFALRRIRPFRNGKRV